MKENNINLESKLFYLEQIIKQNDEETVMMQAQTGNTPEVIRQVTPENKLMACGIMQYTDRNSEPNENEKAPQNQCVQYEEQRKKPQALPSRCQTMVAKHDN
jgi:hypothetical protein